MSLSTSSKRPLNTSRDGDSTTSLGSLFQCLITLSVKKNFLISSLNLPWRNLRPFPLPVPMLDHPFSKEIFPNSQSQPPLAQLEAISSRPIASYLGEETDSHLATTSFQVVVESNKVSPQPPLLQAKQPQFPQMLLIGLVFQTLHQLHCPSLDTLQHLNVSLVVRGPKLNTVCKVQPHQCQVQGNDHFPSPAGHTIPDTSQDAVGFLGHLGTLLAHVQLAVNQHPHLVIKPACLLLTLLGGCHPDARVPGSHLTSPVRSREELRTPCHGR
ncbi:hypothetical protein QYF61_021451, partial [Mycteria americana]